MVSGSKHAREIELASRGHATGRDGFVVESWQRCLIRHGLDPAAACEAVIVPQTRLKEHRQQSEELVHIARSGLERLYAQVAGQNYVLLLSDMQGVTVEFMGDPHFDHRLRRAGLYLGSEWLEERAGTCAIGACLATGEALTIHQDDHFDLTHTPLSCTAAPIYDGLGGLAAVLDISLLSSPTPKVSQNLALHLVTATARRIELANLMASQRRNWVLRFSQSPEFLDVDPDAAIAVDAAGRVCGMTHRGASLLGASIGQAGAALPGLIGERLDRFFHIGIDGLPDLTRDRPAHERLLRCRDGSIVFAHAIEPPTRWKSAASPAQSAPPARQAAASALDGIGGSDVRIDRLRAVARQLAPSTLPILLQGETGTGKEVLAAAIHAASGRQGRFIAINCAAIPEGLIESELFGHAAGAFSGAGKARRGLVEEADGGTLFLDEIGDMPLALQSRLLRVLSEKVVQPVGTSDTRSVDIRILSATNRNLADLVSAGRFRQDLLYRLNAAALDLPPLRERTDFDWLVTRLLGPAAPRLSNAAREALRRHDWPGNIRELANALAYAGTVAEAGEIGIEDLPPSLAQRAGVHSAAPQDEAQRLYATLRDTGWNISLASRSLGVDRTTLHRRMRRLGVARPH
ncbi:Transcriptional regulator of acetoin/glycerol metabolism [Aureimonas altamirensis DSM 21988]|uniref:Transcriptional regulator of acetoin/glycerol metabolism n=1 Tax=Aureimonas altamirensis DSM 21988 TaxID=1121026 RepID=A0ABY1IM63_9HYPH|nr:sigma-54-dependent Fis family transcriptional regulator [Aureimonas altamirensis]SHJ43161.1 Transcriptional regulator of acetoin/glycerol metabolism [Aureimonas altamirensis DSM 21988]